MNKVFQKIDYWKTQLRDSSGRNRLLFFRDSKTASILFEEPDFQTLFNGIWVNKKSIFAPIPEPDENDDQNQLDLIEKSIDEKPTLKPDEFSAKNKSIKQINRTLRNLRYRSRLIREEQGFNTLYLSFGMLKWREGIDGEYSLAPLILIPAEIEKEEKGDRWQVSEMDQDILINPSLNDYLHHKFNINLPSPENIETLEQLESYWNSITDLISNHEGWKIEKTSALAIFNFVTMLIINDLEGNKEKISLNPLVNLLSGVTDIFNQDTVDVPEARELDEKVNPFEVFQILDADSSQQEAIEAAKRGVSFVLQGPPGTGKSQTIANIIAESLISGKKILFASQKSVALDVVFSRLASQGLSDYCLEVHSYKKKKMDVINELGRSLNTREINNSASSENSREKIKSLRADLNEYVSELHIPRFEIKMSLFEATGKYALLSNYPGFSFRIDSVQEVSRQELNTRTEIISEFASYHELIRNFSNHPWHGLTKDLTSITEKETLIENFTEITVVLKEFGKLGKSITKGLGLVPEKTIGELIELLDIMEWLSPDVFNSENVQLFEKQLTVYHKISKYLSPDYWKERKRLLSLFVTKEKNNPKLINEASKLITKYRKKADALGILPPEQNEIADSVFTEIKTLANKIHGIYEYTTNIFDSEDLPDEVKYFHEKSFAKGSKWFLAQLTKTDEIDDWVNFSILKKNTIISDVLTFIDEALEKALSPESWVNTYERRFYYVLSGEIIQSSQVLKLFRGEAHEKRIEKFSVLDKEIIQSSAAKIRKKLAISLPEATWVSNPEAETAILKKELNKKSRIKPLRILFGEIPNLILKIKPCLMMSPLTVSQLLDPDKYQFDIAIFDEASQIPPEYAIGTIYRSKQIIIAGDKKQLPPSRYFWSTDSDDFYSEEDYEIEEYESILNAFDATNLPNRMLTWHYRSEDEALIAFSNYHFYENRLHTFPNPDANSKETGLEYIYVPNGVYMRGKGRDNPVEAKRVAGLVEELLRKNPDQSVGIVTFNQSQRNLISDELANVRQQNPELAGLFSYDREEHLFVKELEAVQGDERDVIIFSVGYGKDELGNMSMNFGPLNRQGGERRLNVAVTRAKKKVYLVSSLKPEEFDLSKITSIGPKLLASYFNLAKYGPETLFENLDQDELAEFGSPFEQAVFEKLTDKGINLKKQVGVSKYRIDFAVVDESSSGRYLIGIECDGATYHSSPTARDRDRLRQEILEDRFGWIIHRIWSRDWFADENREVKKVLEAIKNAKKGRKKKENWNQK